MAEEEERKPEGGTEPESPEGKFKKPSERPLATPPAERNLKDPSQKSPEGFAKGAGEKPGGGPKGLTDTASKTGEAAGAAKDAGGLAGGGKAPALPELPKLPGKEEEEKTPPGEGTPLEGMAKTAGDVKKAAEVGKAAGGVIEKIPTPVTKAGGAALKTSSEIAKQAAGGAEKALKGMAEKAKEEKEEVERAGEEPGEEDLEVQAKEAAKKGKKRLKWGCIGCATSGALGTLGCGGIILFLLVIIVPILLITGGGGGGIGGILAGNTYLNQADPPWGSQVYCGSYGTIAQTGCTVTTGAMALRSIGIDTDPEQLAQKLCSYKGSWGFGMGGQQAAASFYGAKLVAVNSEAELKQAISAGHMVGIYANPAGDISSYSNLQGQPHSVLVIGVSGNQMTVMDPSDANGRGKSKQENVTRTCSLSSWTGAGEKWGYYYTK
jgi:uncharacterized protein YvpB